MAYRKTNVKAQDYIPVPGGLNTGGQVVVRGRVLPNETRFAINLRTGPGESDDIALHFNPRNDGGQTVVRNSFQGGAWQGEERDIPHFPFNNGTKFTIRIMVFPDYYRILVNNSDFVNFRHRIPPQDVRYLQLGAGAEYYEASVQNNCRTPFFGHFPGGLQIGQAVRVRGMVQDDAQRFTINFQNDKEGNHIGLHFNPRQDQGDVVLNAKLGGEWGSEQRGFQGNFLFQRGEFFDAFFVALKGGINVYVNEKLFTTYDYRCKHCEMRHLVVNGDVELMDVELLEPLPDDFVKEIPQGMEKNDLVVTKGFFYPGGNSFSVNLLKGTCCDDDIALHFNPRRNEGQVVFNSKDGGSWGEEERHPLPAAMNDLVPFEVEVLAKKDKFKVYANNKKVCKFRARGDIHSVKAINVKGEAFLYEVKLLRKLKTPFTDSVPGVLEPGNWLLVHGCPDDDTDGFAVNFQCGKDAQSDDIAFHFNPRFKEGVTVRNSRLGGAWGGEERDQPYFPFQPEDRFELAFVMLNTGIRVFVNGKRYVDYNFRVSPDRICHVYLSGGCDYFEPEFF